MKEQINQQKYEKKINISTNIREKDQYINKYTRERLIYQ